MYRTPRRLCSCRSPLPSHLSHSRWTSQTRCPRRQPFLQSMGAMFTASKGCRHQANLTVRRAPYRMARPPSTTARLSRPSHRPVSTSPRPSQSSLRTMRSRRTISCMPWLTCISSTLIRGAQSCTGGLHWIRSLVPPPWMRLIGYFCTPLWLPLFDSQPIQD